MIPSMKQARGVLNRAVAAILTFTSIVGGPAPFATMAALVTGTAAQAQTPTTEDLLRELARPDQDRWMRIERQILRDWAQSGSPALDYLFQRGQAALQSGDSRAAIDHFSAVIDQAPDFAEAWNGRATAFFLANRLGLSLADIEQVLLRNPQHFGALAGLGMILEQLDRPDEARAAYAASLAIHPHQQAVIDALARLDLASAGQAL